MKIMTSYNDLLRKISILEDQLELTEAELNYWFGNGDIVFGTGVGTAKFGMMAAIDNVDTLHKRKHKISKMIDFYKEIEEEMRTSIDSLEGLPYKVARMRFIEGMSYQRIAKDLGYSYGYIRNVASGYDKDMTAFAENL